MRLTYEPSSEPLHISDWCVRQVFAYYMDLWKIFYASYVLLPLAILGC